MIKVIQTIQTCVWGTGWSPHSSSLFHKATTWISTFNLVWEGCDCFWCCLSMLVRVWLAVFCISAVLFSDFLIGYVHLLSLQCHRKHWAHGTVHKKSIPVQCGIQILNHGQGEHWYMTENQLLRDGERASGENESDLCISSCNPRTTHSLRDTADVILYLSNHQQIPRTML